MLNSVKRCHMNSAIERTTGHFPNTLNAARANPLIKGSTLDPSDVRNYRPVSLLPFLSRSLEPAVFTQLSAYLHQNNLIDPHQSGFKAGHSTETALPAVTEKLHSLSSVVILLNLSAAFDTVNHQILLSTHTLPVHILPQGPHLQGYLERIDVRTLQPHCWGPSGLCSGPHPLLSVYQYIKLSHSLTCLFLP